MSTLKNIMPAIKKIFNLFQTFLKLFQTEINEDNVTSVVYRLMKKNGIKVTFNSVFEYIRSHPKYPSLICICDFFIEMKILNYALRIDESDLYKLEDPFIAHTKESGGKVLLIYSINNESIVYADTFKGKKRLSTRQFLEKWDGVIILIEPTELSGETDYLIKRKDEIIHSSLMPSLVLICFLAAIYGIFINKLFFSDFSGLSLYALIFTHIIGLTFSLFLLMHELNLSSKFTDKLCHISTNVNCDAVTKSDASKVFGSITWADLGLAYFSGGLLTCFILPYTYSINNLALFAFAALPYPVFSILYQWLIIKKWCPLCLSVQIVIILESIITYNRLNLDGLNITSFLQVLIVFSIVFLFVLLLKFLFISDRGKENTKLELLKMKRDWEVFLFKLKKGKRINIPSDKYALVFGDTQGKVSISVFLSFHCSACAERFDSVQKMIVNNSKIKVQLILSPANDEMSVRLLKTIFLLIESGQSIKALEKLKIWYSTDIKARSKLIKDDVIHGINDEFKKMIEYNSSLFHVGKVAAVPSVYVNGYPLPDEYLIEDIRYHISELEKMKQKLTEVEV